MLDGSAYPTDDVVIEPACTLERRQAADGLLRDRYRWRGYSEVSLPAQDSIHHVPLVASCKGMSAGTLTVSFEGPQGLSCESVFHTEVRTLREHGHLLCEFTRLAIDPELGTRQVLASLFQVAYLVATRFGGADTVLLEVNPRHVGYYRRILGARQQSDERYDERVQAPAVLLSISLCDVSDRIDEVMGQILEPRTARSLFTLAFSAEEEDAIVSRFSKHVRTLRGDAQPFPFRLPHSRPMQATA